MHRIHDYCTPLKFHPCCTYHGSDRNSYHAYTDTDMWQGISSKIYGHADFALTQKKFSYYAVSQIIVCTVHCDIFIQHKTRNAQFFKLVNFGCVLHVSDVVGSSSGRQLCMQYGFTRNGGCNLVSLEHCPIHQTAHTLVCKTYYTAYTTVLLRINPRHSKHVGHNEN